MVNPIFALMGIASGVMIFIAPLPFNIVFAGCAWWYWRNCYC